ncbi:MAG: type II secretion system F family protein [Elusimicrobia bacterium]|nr:type II secretion system F family protein [Elusimicrobiota bacterium]
MLYSRHIRLYRGLSDACRAGLPMGRALRTLSSRTRDQDIAALADATDAGESMAAAMRRLTERFPAWQSDVIAIGEETGRLDEVFTGLAESLEKRRRFWLRLLPKLLYPAFLLTLAPFAFHISLLMRSGLPAYLRAVALILAPMCLGGAAAGYLLCALARSPRWMRRLPILATILTSNFAQYLALMLKAGVSFSRAIVLAGSSAGLGEDDARLRAALDKANAGGGVCETLDLLGIFSPDELASLEAAEAGGSVDRALDVSAAMAAERAQAAVAFVAKAAANLAFLAVAALLGWRIKQFYADFSTQRVDALLHMQ